MSNPILLPLPLPPLAEAALERAFSIYRLYSAADPRHMLGAIAPQIRVAAVSASSGFPNQLWDRLPQLELVAVHGVGTDKIDLNKAAMRNIRISKTPNILAEDVADLAIGMWISLSRRVVTAHEFVRNRRWQNGEVFPLGRNLQSQNIGILGFGAIGHAIAKRASAFGARVGYHSRRCDNEAPYQFYSNARELAAQSDAMFLALPGGMATNKIIGREILEALGPAGFLINVARGSIVDEDALIEALKTGAIAGAALDVFAAEPGIDKRFLSLENVLLQPHHGSGTRQTRERMAETLFWQISDHFKSAV